MDSNQITVQSTISADSKKVWDYYNLPAHIIHWNFASDDWQCPWAKIDLKVGGKYSARMEAKDGSFGFEFEATYDKVIDQKLISYTMEDGRKASVSFEVLGNKTQVTITFDAENENPVEMQQGGWQAILDNFKKYTESH
ncbi:SRPBCC family protein [Leptospira kanakyensis]|uniref:Activator of HSP90 ATPase n=1 Tax=Leptospira kanakyensis TaxID=2484968 RepID=A0A6N4PZD5_9LEPT|nr:SRPBCC family protein [Leptospira kanakyensis]MCW7469565.1 SRPBCC family protein [Leptospira kanakyensis]MCW7480553.1 SRPBCC family protein [Leptospira kanakyensis]TGK50735.1 activator of HSP90 ATPase [Leptospira kanakyensis]TGK63664.1 activator of HSP90 ATPase [Leptospira kanakyensis]TGK69872.1 activator of HSP90 ATPase [Leptospira kanakyensis]